MHKGTKHVQTSNVVDAKLSDVESNDHIQRLLKLIDPPVAMNKFICDSMADDLVLYEGDNGEMMFSRAHIASAPTEHNEYSQLCMHQVQEEIFATLPEYEFTEDEDRLRDALVNYLSV